MRILPLLVCALFLGGCQNQKKASDITFVFEVNSDAIGAFRLSRYDMELDKMTELHFFESLPSNESHTLAYPIQEPALYAIATDSGKEVKIAVEKSGVVNIRLNDEIEVDSDVARISDFQQTIQSLNGIHFAGMIAEFDRAMAENDQAALVELEKRKETVMAKFTEAMENSVREMGPSALAFDALQYFDLTKNYGFIAEMGKRFQAEYPNSGMSRAIQQRIDLAAKVALGKKAPHFNAKNLEGQGIDLAHFEGRYLLIDFWASWCRPCRVENPKLAALYKEYRELGFDIVSISIDEDPSKWKQAVGRDGMEWEQIMDSDYSIYKDYGLSSIPSNFLLDRSGKIIAKNVHSEVLEAQLKSVLEKADQ